MTPAAIAGLMRSVRWREDVIQPDGTITRPYKWEVLGTIRDYQTRKLALRAYLQSWRPNSLDLLFATRNVTPWDHSLVRKRRFHPLLKKLGIPQCGFHAFRHGNATLLDQIGAPMAVRLNRLGHAEAQTTMGHTDAVTADERRVANEVGSARNEQEQGAEQKALTLRIQ